jgi:hypothetical protein
LNPFSVSVCPSWSGVFHDESLVREGEAKPYESWISALIHSFSTGKVSQLEISTNNLLPSSARMKSHAFQPRGI